MNKEHLILLCLILVSSFNFALSDADAKTSIKPAGEPPHYHDPSYYRPHQQKTYLPHYVPTKSPAYHRAAAGPVAHAGPVVTPAPIPPYGYPTPTYGAKYTPTPGYGGAYRAPNEVASYGPPLCSKNTTRPWCLVDRDYPAYEIQHAIEYHYATVASLYKDVVANTDNSVDRLKYLEDETYLCPSDVAYVLPLRAVNTEGKWRIIVNSVKAHYENLSQTVRVEECANPGQNCPLVPECYETKCLQKFVYHRFLIYNPYDHYFPFSIESFKLPSACACHNGAYVDKSYVKK